MVYKYMFLFLLFLIYSMIGYLVEVTDVSIIDKKINFSRGYLLGPWIPIFGFGAILMISFLNKYSDDIFTLFSMSLVICCLLEYFTSLLMEKLFKLRWWDYSKRKFNINGRVCLENGILFGISGVILVKFFNPLLIKFLLMWSDKILISVGAIFAIIIVVDFMLSTFAILRLKIDTNLYINKDATAVVRKQVINSLQKYSAFHRRFFKAFPNIKNSINLKSVMEHIDKKRNKS